MCVSMCVYERETEREREKSASVCVIAASSGRKAEHYESDGFVLNCMSSKFIHIKHTLPNIPVDLTQQQIHIVIYVLQRCTYYHIYILSFFKDCFAIIYFSFIIVCVPCCLILIRHQKYTSSSEALVRLTYNILQTKNLLWLLF